MVVPPRYRLTIRKTEILQSLGTEDLEVARRLCAARQADWLRRFEMIELELSAREAREGVEAVDRHLDRRAQELDGIDRAVAMALAEAGFLDVPSQDDFGLTVEKDIR